MTISENPVVLFSDNAGQAQYTLSDGEVIYLIVSGKQYLIPVADSSGTLNLSDILRAAPLNKPSLQDDFQSIRARLTAGPSDISDSTGRANVNMDVLMGGIYGKTAAEAFAQTQYAWLTLFRGDTTPRLTAMWGKEPLVFFPYEGDTGGIVTAQVSMRNSEETITVNLRNDGGVGWDRYVPITVNAGYSDIVAALERLDPPVVINYENIVGWRVNFKGGNQGERYTSKTIRYNLMQAKTNYREFVYRNSLGCWDTVYSRGTFKVVPKYNFSSFLNRNVESQLDSQVIEHMEIGSGPLATPVEQRMWLEMIASDEVYLVDQSGDMRLVVIDESSPSIQQKELNSLAVKCHYALKAVGNGTRISIAQ